LALREGNLRDFLDLLISEVIKGRTNMRIIRWGGIIII
jgi:hypothetical protein